MLDMTNWPNWLHATRLWGAFLLTSALGIHAYNAHKLESVRAISPRKWMYWLYSMVFLVAGVANFTQLIITIVFGNYDKAGFYLGYLTVLLALSYFALLAGVRRKGSN